MENGLWPLLLGAGIGLLSAIVGAVVQHLLALRAEQKKREWDREERESRELRQTLAPGPGALESVRWLQSLEAAVAVEDAEEDEAEAEEAAAEAE